MKKIACLVFALFLLIPCAFAESIDLSGLSFEELAALRDRILLEMMLRDEWQEVTVPVGVWKVGESIPAGTWTVKCVDKQYAFVSWGDKLDKSGEDIDVFSSSRYSHSNTIKSTSSSVYKDGDQTEYTFTVKDGDYIVIEHSAIIFMPYKGKPNLGFK